MSFTSSLSNGRTVIPAALREQMNIKDGDQLLWEIHDGQLTVTTRAVQLRKAQTRFQSCVPKDSPSVADELINAALKPPVARTTENPRLPGLPGHPPSG